MVPGPSGTGTLFYCKSVTFFFPETFSQASGAVISGFGCGALVFSPAASALSLKLAQMPEFLGAALETVTRDGR